MSSLETVDRTRVFPVIGLEVHAQLLTRSKMFCPCPVTVGVPANSATCPVCLGFPGTLPVLNRHAVTLAMRLALAAGANIHHDSRFARKNYFYPDLPKGYQISQYDRPLATGGAIDIDTPAGAKSIRLVRIHLEEDAGKLLHDTPYADVPSSVSLVDWNRSGVPLAEIVGEPDLRTPDEAAAYLTELRRLLRFTEVSDADMEKGNLRCDANVSVRLSPDAPFGTRVEIKNLNSIRFVARALEHEIERQARALEHGQSIVLETRLWDSAAGRTVSMRGKEEAHDYRYFPEPDLGALVVDEAWIAEAASELPELPRSRRARFVAEYGLSLADAETLTSTRELADYYEHVAREVAPKLAANWVIGEILRRMKDERVSPEDALSFAISPARLVELLQILGKGQIRVAQAKDLVLPEMLKSTEDAAAIVKRMGLSVLDDSDAIHQAVADTLRNNTEQVNQYLAGRTQAFGWFMGQVIKKTGGSADPATVRADLEEQLLLEKKRREEP